MKFQKVNFWIFIVLFSSISLATSGYVTVTTSSDPIDVDSYTATISDLPGPDGLVSFSEAVIATNNTPGKDTIAFAIPQDEWIFQSQFPGCAVINSSYTYYWRANDTVVVDGRTQTNFTGDTNPDGAEVVLYSDIFYLNAPGSEVYGLHDGEIYFSESNNIAMYNTGGIHITIFGGIGTHVEANKCGTIKIDRSDENVVIGNTMQRVRVLGFSETSLVYDNQIGGPGENERNYITGYGTVDGEGMPGGSTIQLFATANTIIENNWIGTTEDGMAQGNLYSTQGIGFESYNENTIIRNNRIAGILGHGQGPHHAGELYGRAILVAGSGSGVTIENNTIGLNALDEPVLGSVTGIDVGNDAASTVTDITIQNNVIAGHLFNGVTIGHDVSQARLSGNQIYDNNELGIDLVPTDYGYGVTPNDNLDADTGGNGLQNFPVITDAYISNGTLTVTGTLHSTPSSQFTLEFFTSPELDSSGYGEGQYYLGATTVTTDGNGNADFLVNFTQNFQLNWYATATATLEPLGATSEFSAGVQIHDVVSNLSNQQSVPNSIKLYDAYPNPFNPTTTIRYTLPEAGEVSMNIFNSNGQLVRTLLDQYQKAGTHQINWDGKDNQGVSLPSSTYFVQLQFKDILKNIRMVLLK